jgi:hypothetical protein
MPQVEIKQGSYVLGRDPNTHNYVRGKCIELLADNQYLFCFYSWDEIGTVDQLDEFISSLSAEQIKDWKFFDTADEVNSAVSNLFKGNANG